MFCISMYSEVSMPNNTCTIDQQYMLKLIIFLSWLYILDLRKFCISMYSEGINTKLYLHYI